MEGGAGGLSRRQLRFGDFLQRKTPKPKMCGKCGRHGRKNIPVKVHKGVCPYASCTCAMCQTSSAEDLQLAGKTYFLPETVCCDLSTNCYSHWKLKNALKEQAFFAIANGQVVSGVFLIASLKYTSNCAMRSNLFLKREYVK